MPLFIHMCVDIHTQYIHNLRANPYTHSLHLIHTSVRQLGKQIALMHNACSMYRMKSHLQCSPHSAQQSFFSSYAGAMASPPTQYFIYYFSSCCGGDTYFSSWCIKNEGGSIIQHGLSDGFSLEVTLLLVFLLTHPSLSSPFCTPSLPLLMLLTLSLCFRDSILCMCASNAVCFCVLCKQQASSGQLLKWLIS